MSKYQEQHYKDVAHIIKDSWPEAMPEDVNEVILFSLSNRFADLFAADNPNSVSCGYCGATEGDDTVLCPERGLDRTHSFVYHKGFDRERFLKACGLQAE